MTYYKVVDGPADPTCSPTYRGLYRAEPTFCESLPENHELNRMLLSYMNATVDTDALEDLQKARALVSLYQEYVETSLEILEIVTPGQPPISGKQFLGYDLVFGFSLSLLCWGLQTIIAPPHQGGRANSDASSPIHVLARLINMHFQPLLNKNGLFHNLDDARFCLDCMMAIQDISQGFYEYGQYRVVGLYVA